MRARFLRLEVRSSDLFVLWFGFDTSTCHVFFLFVDAAEVSALAIVGFRFLGRRGPGMQFSSWFAILCVLCDLGQ